MTKRKALIRVLVLVAFFAATSAYAQNASFLGDGISEYIRRGQLLGKVNPDEALLTGSFSSNYKAIDSLLSWPGLIKHNRKDSFFNILPVSFVGQYNSRQPRGWNDGGMIPAKGMQTALSAGISFSMGHFSIQLRPEFIYAQNSDFGTFSTDMAEAYWVQYYRWLNNSDIPEKFGDGSYQKIYPGQSSVRYNAGSISFGLSTENLWWGPGVKNALVMSNNAPGFFHATINTIRPIKTGIGNFEGQIIAGQLSGSGILPPERNRYDGNNQLLYKPKREEDRYITGMILSWQPKWVKGLFIGFTKASYQYKSDVSGVADILPLEGLIKSSSEKNHTKAAVGSLFARYLMPQERAELYFEYGRNDKSPNLLNLVSDNGYPRAYVAGVRKLFSLKKDSYLELLVELTQLQLPTAELVFSARSWYTDSIVRHGYTNQGQPLGSGIGPGSNSQTIDISWVKGFNKVGLMFERLLHNNDFYYNAFSNPVDYTRHWVDISTTAHADWQFNKFLLSSQLALVRSLNYQWYVYPALQYFSNGHDVLNFHARVSISYRL